MKGRNFYSYFFVWLFVVGLSVAGFSQTITISSIAPASVCPGSTVVITYTTSGTFSTGNVFAAQLSDASGAFTSPVNLTTQSSTATSLVAVVPPATASATYQIRIASTSPVRNSNSLALAVTTPAPPAVTTPAPYCEGDQASPLVATPSTGGTLNWYNTSISGGTRSSTPSTPSTNVIGNTSYYVSQTINGCESARASIVVTVKAKPAAPGTSPVSYCQGQTASPLSAIPASGGTLNWYNTNATGGTPSSIAPTPSASGTYYVSQTVNGCESARASIVVTFNSVPAAPVATAPNPYCEGSIPVPLAASGQSLRWYADATGGTGSSTATLPNTGIVGTTNYYVSQTVNGCESPRTTIPVQVKSTPPAPATGTGPSYCQNVAASPLSATPVTGATLNWYVSSSGTGSATAPTPSTTQAGTVQYFVSQTLNGCEGPRTTISVTTKATPALPGVSPVIACQSRSASALIASSSAGGTLNWYGTSATGGTATNTAPSPGTDALGSQTYYVSQTVNGCESGRAAIVVTTNPIPALPSVSTPSAYCEGSTAVPLSATGTGLRWYGTNATGGTGTATATTPNTGIIGTTNYYVSQTVNTCESDRAPIPVLVKDTPNQPGTSPVDFCQGTTPPVLTATLVQSANANWYGTSASGGTASSTAPVPGNATVATTTYYVSQTLDGCESPRAGLNVRVKATPAAPGVTPVSFCNNAPAQPLTASGTTIKWYTDSEILLPGAPTPPTSAVGSQTYKASQTSGEGCESGKASLVVTIKPLPGLPSVGNVTYCQAQTDQPAQAVGPLSAGGQNLRWYNPDGNPFPGAPTPAINQAGVQTYQVTQTVDACESGRASIQVVVNTTAAPVVARPLIAYCINDKATPLQATIETGASARWIDPYNRTTSEAPTPLTLNTNIDPAGDPFYVYQIGSNGCYSARSVIRVVVNTTPTLALRAPVSNTNLGLRVPLRLTFTGSAPYSYTISGGYTGTSRSSDTTISVLPRGNTTYQVTAVTNGCGVGLPGNPATAEVTVRIPTISTGALQSTTLCAGTSLTVPFTTTGEFNPGNSFRFELVSIADTSKKYDIQATAGSSPVTATIPLSTPGGQYAVRVKALNPEVGVTGSNSPTQLTIRSLPTATLAGTQTIYEGQPANLTIALGGDGPWTINYADSIRSYTATATTTPYIAEVRPARTTVYRLTSLLNSCGTGTISGTATVSVAPLLGIEDNSLDPLVKAYPVPTSQVLTVDLDMPLTRDAARLSLTSMQGRTVMQQTTRNRQTKLDLSGLPNGLYMLLIEVGDRHTLRKVLKY
ncbi:Ig-like domain-containing protein [Spirosoma rigui]|uniref:Ig-like domain-containing protein n=1 Tax=Spirosoma rigui TaxID=564064 RepID=UPI0009B06595|nr:T9SS type A sorting domain-containing protein [Spirosoma rigui]